MVKFKKYIKKIPLLLIVLVFMFAIFLFIQPLSAFDEGLLNTENIYAHIETLTSPEYYGRLTGTAGGQKAID